MGSVNPYRQETAAKNQSLNYCILSNCSYYKFLGKVTALTVLENTLCEHRNKLAISLLSGAESEGGPRDPPLPPFLVDFVQLVKAVFNKRVHFYESRHEILKLG